MNLQTLFFVERVYNQRERKKEGLIFDAAVWRSRINEHN